LQRLAGNVSFRMKSVNNGVQLCAKTMQPHVRSLGWRLSI
jgi:hypothetical protein